MSIECKCIHQLMDHFPDQLQAAQRPASEAQAPANPGSSPVTRSRTKRASNGNVRPLEALKKKSPISTAKTRNSTGVLTQATVAEMHVTLFSDSYIQVMKKDLLVCYCSYQYFILFRYM